MANSVWVYLALGGDEKNLREDLKAIGNKASEEIKKIADKLRIGGVAALSEADIEMLHRTTPLLHLFPSDVLLSAYVSLAEAINQRNKEEQMAFLHLFTAREQELKLLVEHLRKNAEASGSGNLKEFLLSEKGKHISPEAEKSIQLILTELMDLKEKFQERITGLDQYIKILDDEINSYQTGLKETRANLTKSHETRRDVLLGLMGKGAGKHLPNALGEDAPLLTALGEITESPVFQFLEKEGVEVDAAKQQNALIQWAEILLVQELTDEEKLTKMTEVIKNELLPAPEQEALREQVFELLKADYEKKKEKEWSKETLDEAREVLKAIDKAITFLEVKEDILEGKLKKASTAREALVAERQRLTEALERIEDINQQLQKMLETKEFSHDALTAAEKLLQERKTLCNDLSAPEKIALSADFAEKVKLGPKIEKVIQEHLRNNQQVEQETVKETKGAVAPEKVLKKVASPKEVKAEKNELIKEVAAVKEEVAKAEKAMSREEVSAPEQTSAEKKARVLKEDVAGAKEGTVNVKKSGEKETHEVSGEQKGEKIQEKKGFEEDPSSEKNGPSPF